MRFLAALLLSLPTAAVAGTAWVTSNHIQVVDLDRGEVVGRLPLQEFIHDLEFSPDGATAYVASSKGLRVADADRLEFTQRVSDRMTRGLSLSADGKRLVAIHKAPDEDCLAARRAGLPLPPSTVAVYDTAGMTVEASFPVSGDAFDLAMDAAGTRIYALVPPAGVVEVYDAAGHGLETIRVATGTADHAVMLSELALAPDGRKLVVPVTDDAASWLAEIDLTIAGPDKVLRADLGHARRIQGVRWDEDGSGLYVTAIHSLVKFDAKNALPLAWQAFPVNWVDVQGVPGTEQTVAVTPTLSKARGTGGISVLDKRGEVLRTVELPDMSPFLVAVRP